MTAKRNEENLDIGAIVESATGVDPEEVIERVQQVVAAKRSYTYQPIADVKMARVRWLWEGRIPRGKLWDIEGDGGHGKSTVVSDVMARLTTARPMPDETQSRDAMEPMKVGLLVTEDGLGDTVAPRFTLMGGDKNRLFVPKAEQLEVGGLMTETLGPQMNDPGSIRDLIMDLDLGLLVIDNFTDYLGPGVSFRDPLKVRDRLRPIGLIAQETDCSIGLVRHFNKEEGKSASGRGSGPADVRNILRSGLLVAELPEPQDGYTHILSPHKANLSRMARSLLFRFEEVEYTDDNGELAKIGVVRWGGESDMTADEAIAAQRPDKTTARRSPKREQAKEWLLERLADGPVRATTIEGEFESQHLPFGRSTLHEARRELKIQNLQDKFQGPREWALPGYTKEKQDG